MAGNALSASLVSCRHRTSGCAYASHSSTRGIRAFSELTFHVAMRMRFLGVQSVTSSGA